MREFHLTVEKTARYAVLGEPGPEVQQIWIVCHGYRQLASRFLRRFQVLDHVSRLIVAPEALSRFYVDDHPGRHGPDSRVGATWMTREDRLVEIADYVAYLDRLYNRVREEVKSETIELHALGFSQGAATASRWFAMGQSRIHRLTIWGDLLPPDLDLDSERDLLREAGLTLVFASSEPNVTVEAIAKQKRALEAHGIPHRIITFQGRHGVDPATLLKLAEGA